MNSQLSRLLGGWTMIMALATSLGAEEPARLHWSQLPSLPDKLGMAGAFAGESQGALLVAGGANFPNGFPWQGGKKVWHDEVYILAEPDGKWQVAGKLPRPLAYGVSITTKEGVICIGGSDADRHYGDVFLLSWSKTGLNTKLLPSLPTSLANAAGALVNDTIYIAGGSDKPGELSTLNKLFALNISKANATWEELKPCPGKPRIFPVAASMNGTLYLLGGAALEPIHDKMGRVYLRDAWSYQPGKGWKALADLPKPIAAAPTPAPCLNSSIYIVGGDDGSLVGFQPVEQHPGFPKSILCYDAIANRWQTEVQLPAPRATAPMVSWRGGFVIPSGEIRPGVRSPEVWSFTVDAGH